jgi:hypothetical protein
MQQAGNVQMIPSTTNASTGTLFMNNALDTTLYDQDYPVRKIGKTSTNDFLNHANASGGSQWFAPAPKVRLSLPDHHGRCTAIRCHHILASNVKTDIGHRESAADHCFL